MVQARELQTAPPCNGGSNLCAIAATSAVALAPVIFGTALGFTGPAIDTMQDTVLVNKVAVEAPEDLVVFSSENGVSAEGSFWGACVNLGALVGALAGGPLAERLGRKKAMLLQAPIYAVTYIAIGLSSAYAPLLVARMLLGVGIGICTSSVPTYINEIAPTRLRGAFGAVFQVAVVIGIMAAYLLGAYVFVVDFEGHRFCQWRHLCFAIVAIAAAYAVVVLAVPESPRWLASQGRLDEARLSLARLRGGAAFVGDELQEIHEGFRSSGGTQAVGLRDLWSNRRSFSIGLALMLIQQCSGVNAVIFFQNTIFQDAGMSDPAALGFWVMTVQVIMTALSIPLMDTAGRKLLLLTACTGMCACCVGMMIFFSRGGPGWLAIVCSFAYISFFSVGLGPIPWLMMGEIFPQHLRSLMSSCAAAFNWSCSFLTTKTVASLQQAFTFSGVFAMYGCVLALGAVYVVLRVPETKGKSFAELERMLGAECRDAPLIETGSRA
eukprot:TRINITY_DN71497_c0_g1_i1.p1 TRINITY_DN71497_c0_g1~~TRINITY_DN71497_c0_g1_i1.p1  ORF type:complete len:494 (-),score=122.47 TRINITY_DN71497_c0_g1_i1:174-1655(-)